MMLGCRPGCSALACCSRSCAGAVVGLLLLPEEGLAFACLLGAILAPTDAALGLPIFNNSRVPVRIRRALNIESGLNDGHCDPLCAVFSRLRAWLSMAHIRAAG